MAKTLKNLFLGFLGAGTLVGAIQLSPNLNNGLKAYSDAAVEMTSGIYNAYNANTLTYDEYLDKIKPELDKNKQLSRDLWNGLNGFPNESLRMQYQRNLYGGYKVENQKGKFQVDIEIIEKYVLSDWKSFTGSTKVKDENAKERFLHIQKLFSNVMSNLYETKFSLIQKQDKLKKYRSLSQADRIIIPNQISTNELTLTQSYKLIEWYKSLIILRLEYWRLMNPKDSKRVEKELNILIEELTLMNFNIN